MKENPNVIQDTRDYPHSILLLSTFNAVNRTPAIQNSPSSLGHNRTAQMSQTQSAFLGPDATTTMKNSVEYSTPLVPPKPSGSPLEPAPLRHDESDPIDPSTQIHDSSTGLHPAARKQKQQQKVKEFMVRDYRNSA